MSIYTPINVLPNGNTYDANNNITISWENVAGSEQYSYQILVYDNSDSSLDYDSSEIVSATPTHIIPASTLVNGVDYKFTITLKDSGANSVTSDFYLFKTRSTPVVGLSISSPVNQQNPAFTGTYYQAEGVALSYYYWRLYSASNVLLAQSNRIYDRLLTYQFTGLSNNTTYKAELICASQDKLEGSSGLVSFDVVYLQPSATRAFDAIELDDEGSIRLEWINTKQILGEIVPSATPTYIPATPITFGQAIELQDGQMLRFATNVSIPQGFTYVDRVLLSANFEGVIKRISNNTGQYLEFSYADGKFYYRIYNGVYSRIKSSEEISLPNGYFSYALTSENVYLYIDGIHYSF